jgi:AcrR family transcriptional regulator
MAGVRTATARRQDYVDAHVQLLGAARDLFAEGGPDAVTVSAVAERAGVSRATVHRHIGTRERLLWEITGQLLQRMGAEIAGPLDPLALRSTVGSVIDRVVGDPERARAALCELLGPDPVRAIREESPDGHSGAKMLADEIAMMRILAGGGLGRPGIDPEVLAVINLAGMLLWSVLAGRGVVEGGSDRYRAEVVRLLLHGAINPEAVPELNAGIGEGSHSPARPGGEDSS